MPQWILFIQLPCPISLQDPRKSTRWWIQKDFPPGDMCTSLQPEKCEINTSVLGGWKEMSTPSEITGNPCIGYAHVLSISSQRAKTRFKISQVATWRKFRHYKTHSISLFPSPSQNVNMLEQKGIQQMGQALLVQMLKSEGSKEQRSLSSIKSGHWSM